MADVTICEGYRLSKSGHRFPSVYAALDLGTNNCRLLVAKPRDGDGFDVIDAFSRSTRLGEGLAETGRLSHAAIRRTLSALHQCARCLRHHRVERLRAVATEACRRAVNSGDFLERVRHDVGIEMDVIAPDEEARLAVTGCRSLLDPSPADALIFDIGGGSTELIHVRQDAVSREAKVVRWLSSPVGVVTLSEESKHGLDGERYAAAVNEVANMIRRFDKDGELLRLAAQGRLQMLGTSGTVTTLAGVHLCLERYDRSRVDGMTIDFSALANVTRLLVDSDMRGRARHPCVGWGRAELVVSGCVILEAICRNWPAGRLRVADRGVREGLLLSMMAADRAVPA